ncbi:uncharacterized protein [Hetaerina americana]|uniref:uncharacterized protein n=1 Tax=Hetaerina americana TaxID=62018 RepID=UPI003A7F321B
MDMLQSVFNQEKIRDDQNVIMAMQESLLNCLLPAANFEGTGTVLKMVTPPKVKTAGPMAVVPRSTKKMKWRGAYGMRKDGSSSGKAKERQVLSKKRKNKGKNKKSKKQNNKMALADVVGKGAPPLVPRTVGENGAPQLSIVVQI